MISAWLARSRQLPTIEIPNSTTEDGPETVREVVLAYLEHASVCYRGPDAEPTPKKKNLADALDPVVARYREIPATDFGPLRLRDVRDWMIRSGLARTTINARIHRISGCFRWAMSVQKIPGTVIYEFETVESLAAGRSEAAEADPITPVPPEVVEKTLPKLSRMISAMVEIQLLTGCRAGEVMVMRGCHTVAGKGGIEYRPPRHKTEWRGKEKVIPLGPKALAILERFKKPDPTAYLFDPRDTLADIEVHRLNRRPEFSK